MAHYSPLHDANKQVIGAVFIGMDFSAFLESIKKTLRELKVGKDGYYFVMQTSGPQRGTILVHPAWKATTCGSARTHRGTSTSSTCWATIVARIFMTC